MYTVECLYYTIHTNRDIHGEIDMFQYITSYNVLSICVHL